MSLFILNMYFILTHRTMLSNKQQHALTLTCNPYVSSDWLLSNASIVY